MLQGRFEWAVGIVGVAVVGTIVAWYAVVWTRHVERTSTSDAPRAVRSPPPPTVVKVAPPAVSPTVAKAPAGHRPEVARVAFVASRGGSWLLVRSGSHSGPVLYEGTISQGARVSVRSPRVWARFGAGSNLDLRVNGKPVTLPRFGTFDVFVTARGVRPDPTFHPDSAPQATAAQSP